MALLHSQKLQIDQTNPDNGIPIKTYDVDKVGIQIFGTSTSFTLNFEATMNGINYFPIVGDKMSNYGDSNITTSTLDEGWEFDTSLVIGFRTRLVSIDNGSITVIANSIK